MRVFRLSRIRGKVAYATKAEHDFQRPDRLRPARLRQPRPTGSSATPVGTAEVWVSEPHRLAGRAPLRPLRRDRAAAEDGGRSSSRTPVRQRAPARRLGARARRARAPRRAARARRRGSTSASTLLRRAPRAASSSSRRRRRSSARRDGAREAGRRRPTARREARDPPRALRPPGHARLDPDRGRPRAASACSVADVCERLQISDAGAARGRQRAQRRQLRRRLLRPLRRGRATTARSRSTPSPTRTTSPARRGCCRSRPRRWWRRST